MTDVDLSPTATSALRRRTSSCRRWAVQPYPREATPSCLSRYAGDAHPGDGGRPEAEPEDGSRDDIAGVVDAHIGATHGHDAGEPEPDRRRARTAPGAQHRRAEKRRGGMSAREAARARTADDVTLVARLGGPGAGEQSLDALVDDERLGTEQRGEDESLARPLLAGESTADRDHLPDDAEVTEVTGVGEHEVGHTVTAEALERFVGPIVERRDLWLEPVVDSDHAGTITQARPPRRHAPL